ncbi:MAG: T9SS type A sorting domain-containing protein [Sphingobacteriales bacterium]|nr:MAG: T9SS type A sorting domain-containing protein [Sphingobacteriales bacterium]
MKNKLSKALALMGLAAGSLNASAQTEYLVTIDPVTGVFTKVKDIPGVHWVMMGSTTYDSDNHRYVFKGSADQASWHLFTIDAVTGNTVSSPTYPAASGTSSGTVHRLQYDHAMQKYFGLTWNNDENQEFLVEVDPVTGFYTQVGAVQGLSSLSKASYDEAHHRFMVVGPDFGGIWHLYSIDVNTAAVVSSPTFPELSSPTKNVIEFQYDNASEILYALHWDPTQVDSIETTGISNMQPGNRLFDVYPNPFADQVKIALPGTFREVSTELTNALGQVVRQQTDHNTSTLTLHRNGLASGVYFIMVTGDRQNMGTQKVVIK